MATPLAITAPAAARPIIPPQQTRSALMAHLLEQSAPDDMIARPPQSVGEGIARTAGMGLDALMAKKVIGTQQAEQQQKLNDFADLLEGVNPELASAARKGVGLDVASQVLANKYAPPKQPETTDDIREYNFAKSQGFEGTLQEFMTKMRQAGAQRSVSPPQAGERYVYDDAGNVVSVEPIPGSKAALAAEAAAAAERSKVEQKGQKAVTMLDSTQSIRDEIGSASTPVTGTLSRPFALYSGSPAGRVRAYVGALKSGVGLQALASLKELSATGASGFGALNQAELQLLLDQVGALDPDNTEPDIFLKTIDRIEQQWQQVLNDVERTVPPERLVELGIDINDLRGGAGGAAGAGKPPPASATPGGAAAAEAPAAPAIPQGAIEMLRSNPSLATEFDKKYGAGASSRILNGG